MYQGSSFPELAHSVLQEAYWSVYLANFAMCIAYIKVNSGHKSAIIELDEVAIFDGPNNTSL